MIDELDDSTTGQLIRVTVRQVNDSGQQQLVSAYGYDNHPIDEAVRLQHFGATSNPPAGSEGHALIVGGRYDRAVLLGLEHPDHRPQNLPSGSKAIYDASGNIIKLVGDSVSFGFDGHPWTATFKGGSLTSDGKDFYLTVSGANLYLGGKQGDSFSPVQTVAGPSKNVFAAI